MTINIVEKKGKLITFEGPDGSGKSTIMKMVVEKLQKEGIEVEHSREPGGNNPMCEEIRKILLHSNHDISYKAEALLFAASRAQHLEKYILPKINSGVNIIIDRFVDSSLAFQGYGRKLGFDEVLKINEFAIGRNFPDLTIFFNLPMDLGFKRIFENRINEINRLDKDSIEMKDLIYNGYKLIADKFNERFVEIDAKNPIEIVFKEVYKIVKEKILNG